MVEGGRGDERAGWGWGVGGGGEKQRGNCFGKVTKEEKTGEGTIYKEIDRYREHCMYTSR